MTTEHRTPLKRSPQLAPLSREHHDGLLFAWKIRQGVSNGTSPILLKEYVQWYWRKFLLPHCNHEESILAPYIEDETLLRQLKQEHADIRDLITTREMVSDRSSFIILATFVENHIRFEERQLFTYLQKILSKEELDAIGEQLHSVTTSAEQWKEEFWVSKSKPKVAVCASQMRNNNAGNFSACYPK